MATTRTSNKATKALIAVDDNADEKPIKAIAAFKNKTAFINSNGNSTTHKPLFVVSLFSNNHQGKNLDAILKLFRRTHKNHPDNFKNLEILIAGSIQKYNFWNLTKKCNSATLKELLQNIPDLSNLQTASNLQNPYGLEEKADQEDILRLNLLDKLADILAKRLNPYARNAQNEYIKSHISTFKHILSIELWNGTFHTWEEMVTRNQDSSVNYENYRKYYKQVLDMYSNKDDRTVFNDFEKTKKRVTEANRDLILEQAKRILKANDQINKIFEYFVELGFQKKLAENAILKQKLENKGEQKIESDLEETTELKSKKMLVEAKIIQIKEKLLNQYLIELAQACSLNLLLEECASIIDLSDRGYSIIYPGHITPAFAVTLNKYNRSMAWMEIVIEEKTLEKVLHGDSNEYLSTPSPLSPFIIPNSARLPLKVKPQISEERLKKTNLLLHAERLAQENHSQLSERLKKLQCLALSDRTLDHSQLVLVTQQACSAALSAMLSRNSKSWIEQGIEDAEEEERKNRFHYFTINVKDPFIPSFNQCLFNMEETYDLNGRKPSSLSTGSFQFPIYPKLPEAPHDLEFNIQIQYKIASKEPREVRVDKLIFGNPLVTGCKPDIDDPKLAFPIKFNLCSNKYDNFIYSIKLNVALAVVGFFRSSWRDPNIDPRVERKTQLRR